MEHDHRGHLQITLTQDPAFMAWLSGQFAELHLRFNRLETHMTAQTDKLIADVTALINEAVADITAALARAQSTSPDPAIDALDAQVTATTQRLKDAMAATAGTAAGAPQVTQSPPPANPSAGL